MNVRFFHFILLTASLILGACGSKVTSNTDNSPDEAAPDIYNSIYHWKTTFALDSTERSFLRTHDIRRIYLRMFDVEEEYNPIGGIHEVVPIATTKFFDSIPAGIEIVPTVYITVNGLRLMHDNIAEYAQIIVDRVIAMHTYNKCGKLLEVQFDCDWTEQTRIDFFSLCEAARDILHKQDSPIELSSTIRLHQLRQDAPPVDCGVLMIYNTGSIKDRDTRNSILDINDVRPYLKKKVDYPLPLDHAYPTFGWGVRFRDDGSFAAIVSNIDSIYSCEDIRIERPTAAEVVEVKNLIESRLGKPSRSNIIYHLDQSQLKHFSDDEISQIFTTN